MTMIQRLQAILREVFDNPQLEVGEETTAADVDGWDSLSHVNVLVAVETHFKIKFSSREALTFRNVGEMARCVEKHLQA